MLDRRCGELIGDPLEHRLALYAVFGEHAHLDETMRAKGHVDLVHHSRRQAMLPDADDRMEGMRLRTQLAASQGG